MWRYPPWPGVACVTGVACDVGSGQICVFASQIVTLVGKFSPIANFSGVEGVPFAMLTL